jgi:hypothetical protein
MGVFKRAGARGTGFVRRCGGAIARMGLRCRPVVGRTQLGAAEVLTALMRARFQVFRYRTEIIDDDQALE